MCKVACSTRTAFSATRYWLITLYGLSASNFQDYTLQGLGTGDVKVVSFVFCSQGTTGELAFHLFNGHKLRNLSSPVLPSAIVSFGLNVVFLLQGQTGRVFELGY